MKPKSIDAEIQLIYFASQLANKRKDPSILEKLSGLYREYHEKIEHVIDYDSHVRQVHYVFFNFKEYCDNLPKI